MIGCIKVKSWLRDYKIEVVIIVIGLIMMHLIFIAKAFRETDVVNPTGAGQLGDFVGGYIGTCFALLSVVLLWSTLRHQRQASQQQYFETKYFELIKMHRDNVAEIKVREREGRMFFVLLIREFRSLLNIVRKVAQEHNQILTQEQIIHITYYCLYFGTGPNSSRQLKKSLLEFWQPFINDLVTELDKSESKDKAKKDQNLGYTPFEGHQHRIGHYYRHLYQAVKYVDQQTIDIDKYEYVKTIRAQLSTHEQALLLLNSLSPIGCNWWKKDFLINYRLVQNIPHDFFDPDQELNVSRLFRPGYFEWEDVVSAT